MAKLTVTLEYEPEFFSEPRCGKYCKFQVRGPGDVMAFEDWISQAEAADAATPRDLVLRRLALLNSDVAMQYRRLNDGKDAATAGE
jgi:hypothetical protein